MGVQGEGEVETTHHHSLSKFYLLFQNNFGDQSLDSRHHLLLRKTKKSSSSLTASFMSFDPPEGVSLSWLSIWSLSTAIDRKFLVNPHSLLVISLLPAAPGVRS